MSRVFKHTCSDRMGIIDQPQGRGASESKDPASRSEAAATRQQRTERPPPSPQISHVLTPDKVKQIKGSEKKGTSGQVTRKATLDDIEGVFYLKDSDNNATAIIEALALIDAGVLSIDDIYFLKNANRKLSLLTRDIEFISVHSLFHDKSQQNNRDILLRKDRSVFTKSVAERFAKLISNGDDDGHGSNFGFTPSLDEVTRIDLDRIRFLTTHGHKNSRGLLNILDFSQPGCFEISADLLDRFIYKGRVKDKPLLLPHYHPLMVSTIFSSTQNGYKEPEVKFFREVFEHPDFEQHFINTLILDACKPDDELNHAAACLGIDKSPLYADYCSYRTDRHKRLRKSCIKSRGVQEYLLSPGALSSIKIAVQKAGGLPEALAEIVAPAIHILKCQLLRKHGYIPEWEVIHKEEIDGWEVPSDEVIAESRSIPQIIHDIEQLTKSEQIKYKSLITELKNLHDNYSFTTIIQFKCSTALLSDSVYMEAPDHAAPTGEQATEPHPSRSNSPSSSHEPEPTGKLSRIDENRSSEDEDDDFEDLSTYNIRASTSPTLDGFVMVTGPGLFDRQYGSCSNPITTDITGKLTPQT